MIKAIILDVDGVIVGEKKGFNFPLPHPKVIARLRTTKAKGIPISLCTAKPHYAVARIISDASLNNIHITMGGGVIIDPIDNIVLKTYVLPNDKAREVTQIFLNNGIYTEVYTVDNYLIQSDQVADLTDLRTQILLKDPVIVDSLIEAMANHEIVKVLPIAHDEAGKHRVAQLFKPYETDLTMSWATHPFMLPRQAGNITAPNISKKQAVAMVADNLNVQPKDILGVGDSAADWQFIESCGYGAATGNAADELKQLVRTKGDHGYIGTSVNEHGLLNIFDHFNL